MRAPSVHLAGADRPLPPATAAHIELERLERLARLLDSHWRIPGTGIRFGVDAVAGLVPGIGDLAMGLVSAAIVLNGARLGAPAGLVARMGFNVFIDVAIGSIPLAGTVFDVFFKANLRNIRLLQDYLAER